MKLNYDLAEEARLEYKRGIETYDSLAEKYGVSTCHMGRVLRNETWKKPNPWDKKR